MSISLSRPVLSLAAVSLALGLSACSDRDTKEAEKIAQINASVERAEQAADRAEKAAAGAPAPEPPVTEEAEPNEVDMEEAAAPDAVANGEDPEN